MVIGRQTGGQTNGIDIDRIDGDRPGMGRRPVENKATARIVRIRVKCCKGVGGIHGFSYPTIYCPVRLISVNVVGTDPHFARNAHSFHTVGAYPWEEIPPPAKAVGRSYTNRMSVLNGSKTRWIRENRSQSSSLKGHKPPLRSRNLFTVCLVRQSSKITETW